MTNKSTAIKFFKMLDLKRRQDGGTPFSKDQLKAWWDDYVKILLDNKEISNKQAREWKNPYG